MADDSAKVEGPPELSKDVLAPAEGPRENLIVTAVKFMQNPKVHQSPLAQKKAFLESKGLTKDEIQLAIQRAGVTDDASSSETAQPPHQLQHPAAYANSALVPAQQFLPPLPPISPWTKAREIAMTTAVIAAVSYTVYNVFQTYVRPWLLGQSETEKRMARMESNIAQLHTSVAESTTQMAETLKAIQESLTLQRDKSSQGAEIGLRQESHALTEIKSEISSLKGLLLNRRQFPPPPMTSPIIPAWQKSTMREDIPQLSPLQAESATSPTKDSVNGLEDKGLTGDSSLEKEETPLIDSTASLTNQTSAESLQARDASVSQSASSTNSGFEMVKPNSESDASAEVD
ncbi:peroxisomal membrane protein PEX14-like [Littorina saxatilis]|uniref:Peroxisomal membrane protein PEX14 n=1 Tax=Littorina saxatilis TaxID=31220 RepID=A0AAN9G442_9CAEN